MSEHQRIKGQEVGLRIFVRDVLIKGLDPMSITESRGVITSVWRVSDASAMAAVDGANVELRAQFCSPDGEVQLLRWTGEVIGIGIASRTDCVTVTIEGVRREWGQASASATATHRRELWLRSLWTDDVPESLRSKGWTQIPRWFTEAQLLGVRPTDEPIFEDGKIVGFKP